MSTNTGRAPTNSAAFADDTKENDVVMTSSPSFNPCARSRRCRAAVPLEIATALATPPKARERTLEVFDHGPLRELAAVEHGEHRLPLLLTDLGSRDGNRLEGIQAGLHVMDCARGPRRELRLCCLRWLRPPSRRRGRRQTARACLLSGGSRAQPRRSSPGPSRRAHSSPRRPYRSIRSCHEG